MDLLVVVLRGVKPTRRSSTTTEFRERVSECSKGFCFASHKGGGKAYLPVDPGRVAHLLASPLVLRYTFTIALSVHLPGRPYGLLLRHTFFVNATKTSAG